MVSIGDLFALQGEYDQALEYFFQCLEARKEWGNQTAIANAYNIIARIYRKQYLDKHGLAVEDSPRRSRFLVELLKDQRIIVQASETGKYSFVHRTVLEYLAGAWLAEQAKKHGVEAPSVPIDGGVHSPLTIVDYKSYLDHIDVSLFVQV